MLVALPFALQPLRAGFTSGVDAHALSGGTYLPEAAARSYFGDEIECSYYTSSGRQNATFRYYGTDTFDSIPGYPEYIDGQLNPEYNSDTVTYCTNAHFLVYSAELTGIVNDPTQIVVDIQPQYSIFDTSQIHCCIGLAGTNYSTAAYISASWDWYFSGNTEHCEAPSNEFGFGLRASSHTTQTWYNLVPVNLDSQSTTSGYSIRAVFPVADQQCYLIIGCPYVSLGSSGESGIGSLSSGSGTTTSSSSGSGGNDMQETNGLLGGILDAISGIGDMLLGLFIPDDDFLQNWIDSMDELLHDHLGGLYEAIDEITDMFDSFDSIVASGSFHVDGCNIPLAGSTLTLGNWDVPLKTNALPSIFYDALAYIVDFLAVAAFLNMCKKKVELFLYPDSEVIQS